MCAKKEKKRRPRSVVREKEKNPQAEGPLCANQEEFRRFRIWRYRKNEPQPAPERRREPFKLPDAERRSRSSRNRSSRPQKVPACFFTPMTGGLRPVSTPETSTARSGSFSDKACFELATSPRALRCGTRVLENSARNSDGTDRHGLISYYELRDDTGTVRNAIRTLARIADLHR